MGERDSQQVPCNGAFFWSSGDISPRRLFLMLGSAQSMIASRMTTFLCRLQNLWTKDQCFLKISVNQILVYTFNISIILWTYVIVTKKTLRLGLEGLTGQITQSILLHVDFGNVAKTFKKHRWHQTWYAEWLSGNTEQWWLLKEALPFLSRKYRKAHFFLMKIDGEFFFVPVNFSFQFLKGAPFSIEVHTQSLSDLSEYECRSSHAFIECRPRKVMKTEPSIPHRHQQIMNL